MPIIGWWCGTERRPVDINHFSEDGFGHTPMPTLLIDKVLSDDRNSPVAHHAGPCHSPSAIKTCPRETILTRFTNYRPDPKSYNNMLFGTAMHGFLEKIDNGGWWHEFKLPPAITDEMCQVLYGKDLDSQTIMPEERGRLTTPPMLFGVPMYGVIDRLKKDFSTLEDYKTKGEWSYDFHCKRSLGVAEPDDAVQLNIYRIMIKEIFNKEIDTMRVWYGTHARAGVNPWDPSVVPYMTEDEILAHQPGGGSYTIKQILSYLTPAFEMIKERLEDKSFA